jgi:hypothetical protein
LAWLDRGVILLELRLPAAVSDPFELEEVQVVTIGIDPHKASHTAVALDAGGKTVGQLRVPADASMLARVQAWGDGLAGAQVGDRRRRRPRAPARAAARRGGRECRRRPIGAGDPSPRAGARSRPQD